MFPYGIHSEQAFLQHEVKYLQNLFSSVLLVPSSIIGEQKNFGNFDSDISYAKLYNKKKNLSIIKNSIFNIFFYTELFSRGISFWNIKRIKKLAVFLHRSRVTLTWLKRKKFDKGSIIIYTFWLNDRTFASNIYAKGKSNVKVISRAHGHDIYENNPYFFGYLPFQKTMIANLNKLYLVSQPAVDYLENKYPEYKSKFTKKYLGVKHADYLSKKSSDGTLRIVSCSFMLDRKRIDLTLNGILAFINKYNRKVKWTHIGSGPLYDEINNCARQYVSEYFQYNLTGIMENRDIFKYYSDNPVDVIISTTAVEGGVPLVIQEAQAFGIPVIATNVGGIPEIINSNVGILLQENPDEKEISEAIYKVCFNEKHFLRLRNNSVENWRKNFNESVNCKNFSEELFQI